MTEIDEVERLWDRFIGNMNEHPLHFPPLEKDHVFGDDDGRLWHFTRLSVLKRMLEGRQIWLTDLALCNDADEIRYGLRRVTQFVKDIHTWCDPGLARKVQRLAKEAAKRFGDEFHVFAFCLSEERDTRQHWEAYGGGLQNTPSPDDPYVSIGFDGKALAYPLELSSLHPPIDLFSVATVTDHMDRLAGYWAFNAKQNLEHLERKNGKGTRRPSSMNLVRDALARALAFTCALMKDPGWQSELEYRLLYLNPTTFGEKDKNTLSRPGGLGNYVPLIWEADNLPIQAVVVHPLGETRSVKRQLRRLRAGKDIEVIPSRLKPRPHDS
jgi:hypothetical protein